jgi:hypothetical protein
MAKVQSAVVSAVCVGQVEVHMSLGFSSLSADSLRCHLGKEGSLTCGFNEALPGVFVLQTSPFYRQETQHAASSRLGPWPMVS